MTGMYDDRFYEELRTGISWLSEAIAFLSEANGVESYEICLLKNKVEPEEAKAIENAFFLNARNANSLVDAEIERIVIDTFTKENPRFSWRMSRDVLMELWTYQVQRYDALKSSKD
ncbi:hypothetical protein EJ419_01680 [Alloscardovia theropitheci]|uniref:Uncharacterized protein n=1 Tax=Alloscardovia theropitheci TaxID=2496842 RepID=A0A4R0QR57_9BIFI|nr:hypothetical protein [Alloscardovia theropitheci]TCD54833.1 hypothetical protein EJ419_01680 [Alloscardovia theropitheci]